MGEQTRYSRVEPDSQSFGSLDNILVNHEYSPEELTNEYLLIGFRNTLKRGSSLQRQKFPDSAHYPYFSTIENIIEYIGSSEWSLKEFIFTIENTLKSGYDLKLNNNMERQEVYNRLDTERQYQDLRWSPRREKNDTPDESKPPAEWVNYMEHHIGLAKQSIYLLNDQDALAEIRKVAALAVRCIEIHGCPERVIPADLLVGE